MSLVFRGNASDRYCRDSFWMEDDPSEEVVILFLLPRNVPLSGYKDSSFRIVSSEYYWELGVVDPSALPIYFRLRGSKPRVSEDGFLLAKFGKIKPEVGVVTSRLYLQIGVVT